MGSNGFAGDGDLALDVLERFGLGSMEVGVPECAGGIAEGVVIGAPDLEGKLLA